MPPDLDNLKAGKSPHGIRLRCVQDSRHGIFAVKHRDIVQILAAARIFDKKTARSREPAHDFGCKPLPWTIAVGRNDELFDPLQPVAIVPQEFEFAGVLTTLVDRRKLVRFLTIRDWRRSIGYGYRKRESALDRRQGIDLTLRDHESLVSSLERRIIQRVRIPKSPAAARALPKFLAGASVLFVYDNPTLKEREHHDVAVAVRDHAPVSLPVSGIDRVTNGRFRADVAALESLDTHRTERFHGSILRLSIRSDCSPTSPRRDGSSLRGI